MGKKHKSGNRTKNNARPSSSSHSAELLGNSIPTFFGFSCNTDGGYSVCGIPADDVQWSINPDFQILFKQMNKKDATTRSKALQMFTDLCNNSNVDTVKGILPLWPRMYCTLCTDIEHKVREAAHVAHNAVVSKVKKMIAPYLKELAGPWFTSQYDTYAPAATAATAAFQEAFPQDKQNKAILFCQEEILSYIYDNLINQSPQTLSNPNTTSSEDMQARYDRTIIASLQGYSLYLGKLSGDEIKKAEDSNKKLLSSPKFWKYARNNVPLVRSCFFHVIISLCQSAKFLLQGELLRVSSAVFNNLDESDPVVLHAVWDAALNVLVALENCWSHIDIEKQVFAKLCAVLKNGGRNVSTIYPNILPFLSKLPACQIKDKGKFFGKLFENMRCGLEIETYSHASSEAKIIANTFVECLKYVVIKNSSDAHFCESLVTDHLIPALKQKLSPAKGKKPLSTPFLAQASSLVHYWFSNLEGNPIHERLLQSFFLSLNTLYSEQLFSGMTKAELEDVLSNQMDFLSILLDPSAFSSKSKGRVKFEEDGEQEEMMIVEDPIDEDFARGMVPFAKKLAAVYFEKAVSEGEKSYIPPVSKLIQLFDSKPIFEEMVAAANESTCFKLFTSYFSKWLMNAEMKCGEVVDLSFSLLKHVTEDEKEYILEEFCNNWFSDTLQLNVCKALPNYSEDDSIIKWVRSDKFATSILRLVERFVEGDGEDKTCHDILMMLLKAKCANGEFIINADTSGSIMNIVSKALAQAQAKPHVVKLSQDMMSNATSEQIKLSSVEDLLSSLFKLWCYQEPEEGDLMGACKTGLQMVLRTGKERSKDFEFTKKLSEVIVKIIATNEVAFLPERIMANINVYIEMALQKELTEAFFTKEGKEEVMKIVKMLLEGSGERNEYGSKVLEKYCRLGFEGAGELDLEYLELENYLEVNSCKWCTMGWSKYPKFNSDMVKRYAKWNLYAGGILNLIAAAHSRKFNNPGEPEDEGESAQEEAEEVIPSRLRENLEESRMTFELDLIERFGLLDLDENCIMGPFLEEIRLFLLSVGLLESFNTFYANTKHYKELKPVTDKLKATACNLLKNVNPQDLKLIYNYCKVYIQRESIWWLVKDCFREMFNKKFPEPAMENMWERWFEDLKKTTLKKQAMYWGDCLRIFVFIEKGFGPRFSEAQWDSIFVYFHDFFYEFLTSPEYTGSSMMTLSAVARVYVKLLKIFWENHKQPVQKKVSRDTCLVWNQVVQIAVYRKFILAWRQLAKLCYKEEELPPEWYVALHNVSDVVVSGIPLRKSKTPEESLELESECGLYMTTPHAVIQISAFRITLSVIPDLVKLDSEAFGTLLTQMFHNIKDSASFFRTTSNGDWSAKNLAEEIGHNQGIVETLLSDFVIGDCCTVEPFTDSFTYTYSYLLLWCFLLEMCGEAHSALRFQYGCWLQEGGYSKTFLESVFKLMPQMVLHGSESNDVCRKYFEKYTLLNFRDPVSSDRIEQVACFAYRLFIQRLPNVVREWCNQVDNKTSSLVDRVTTLYVSPVLIANELKSVQQDRESGFDNVDIKTYPNSREVIATYTIDEAKMDLIITLPPNYPLGSIKIDSSNVLISTSNWRNWLFQVSKYLIHQNGTIWDALVIWKNNLDKKFEGVEECYICFSILQGSTFEVPRLCCHTCRKKFHSNCLYKWFSTSNKSTCPICRNLF